MLISYTESLFILLGKFLGISAEISQIHIWTKCQALVFQFCHSVIYINLDRMEWSHRVAYHLLALILMIMDGLPAILCQTTTALTVMWQQCHWTGRLDADHPPVSCHQFHGAIYMAPLSTVTPFVVSYSNTFYWQIHNSNLFDLMHRLKRYVFTFNSMYPIGHCSNTFSSNLFGQATLESCWSCRPATFSGLFSITRGCTLTQNIPYST